VFVLLDGVDGASSTANNAKAQFESIRPLFQQAIHWAKQQVFLKVFLPRELEMTVANRAKAFYQQSGHAVITWDVENLAKILRRRVHVASKGKFASLNAISSRAVRDVELLIAERAYPLPRESLVLAGHVLDNYFTRCGGIGDLELDDIAHAEEQYHKGMPYREIFQA
jgi:hypothetical protein